MQQRTVIAAGLLAFLGLLIIVGAVLFLSDEQTDTRTANNPNRNTVEQDDKQTSDRPLITTVSTLYNSKDPHQLHDRQVQFTSVEVGSVVGEKYFIFGQDDKPLYGFLSEQLRNAPGHGVEQGNLLNIRGTVKHVANAEQAANSLGLSAEEAEALAQRGFYIEVWSTHTTQ